MVLPLAWEKWTRPCPSYFTPEKRCGPLVPSPDEPVAGECGLLPIERPAHLPRGRERLDAAHGGSANRDRSLMDDSHGAPKPSLAGLQRTGVQEVSRHQL